MLDLLTTDEGANRLILTDDTFQNIYAFNPDSHEFNLLRTGAVTGRKVREKKKNKKRQKKTNKKKKKKKNQKKKKKLLIYIW